MPNYFFSYIHFVQELALRRSTKHLLIIILYLKNEVTLYKILSYRYSGSGYFYRQEKASYSTN